jgi:molybdate transport system substrate-binding protein
MILRAFHLSIVLLLASGPVRADVLIFAAASLKEPVDQIAARFDDVVVSYGGSGTLARQISLGAPADIVLLANTDWMNVLVDGDHVVPESVAAFASNRLVLIGGQGASAVALEPAPLLAALGDGRIAVGLTEAVPAGIYAKSGLQSLGLWELSQDRLAEVENVRAALMLVARGQAPLGVVYQTDMAISDAVSTLAVFPSDSHPPIRYLGALTGRMNANATTVLDFILSPEGQSIFAVSGFLPPAEIMQ